MPHIHTEPGQHDFTTTSFIVRVTNDGPVAFLHMHRKLHMLLPVGGHVELDETPWAAALHELREESGYEPSQLKILQPIERVTKMTGTKVHPVPLFLQTHTFSENMDHYHSDVGFAFITTELPKNLPEAGETQEVIWLSRDEVADRVNEMPPDIADIYEFVFATALDNWEQVELDAYDA